jgi:hypothetical protein
MKWQCDAPLEQPTIAVLRFISNWAEKAQHWYDLWTSYPRRTCGQPSEGQSGQDSGRVSA